MKAEGIFSKKNSRIINRTRKSLHPDQKDKIGITPFLRSRQQQETVFGLTTRNRFWPIYLPVSQKVPTALCHLGKYL